MIPVRDPELVMKMIERGEIDSNDAINYYMKIVKEKEGLCSRSENNDSPKCMEYRMYKEHHDMFIVLFTEKYGDSSHNVKLRSLK